MLRISTCSSFEDVIQCVNSVAPVEQIIHQNHRPAEGFDGPDLTGQGGVTGASRMEKFSMLAAYTLSAWRVLVTVLGTTSSARILP